jgi:hypothetical protein
MVTMASILRLRGAQHKRQQVHVDVAAQLLDVGQAEQGRCHHQVGDEFGLPDGRLVEHERTKIIWQVTATEMTIIAAATQPQTVEMRSTMPTQPERKAGPAGVEECPAAMGRPGDGVNSRKKGCASGSCRVVRPRGAEPVTRPTAPCRAGPGRLRRFRRSSCRTSPWRSRATG